MKPVLAWTVGGLAAYSVVLAAAAALAGPEYIVPAVIVGLVPLMAACAWVALARRMRPTARFKRLRRHESIEK